MITTSESFKAHDELIMKKGHHLTQLESGTPFFEDQEFEYLPSINRESDNVSIENTSQKDVESISWSMSFFQDSFQSAVNTLERYPYSPKAMTNLGLEYLRLGNVKNALKTFKKVLEIDPTHFPAKANMAKCYMLTGEIEKSIAIYKTLEGDNANNFTVLNNLAHLYFQQRKFDPALEYFKRAYKVNPKNHTVLNNIGLIYLTKKETKKAISFIRKSLKISNNDHVVYNNFGICFALMGEIEKSIKYFKIAYSLNNNNRDILWNLSNAYQQLGKHEEVIKILSDFLNVRSSEHDLRNVLAHSLFKTSKYKESLSQLFYSLKQIDINHSHVASALYNNIGVIYLYLGEESEGEKFLLKSLEINKRANKNIYCNVIEYYLKKYSLEKARMMTETALSIYPDETIFLYYLSECFFKDEDYISAEKILNDIILKDNKFLPSYLALSSIYTEVYGEPARALSLLENVFEYHSDDILFINNYAYALILLDRLAEGRAILDKVSDQKNAHLSATRGLLLIKEGNILEGRRLYNLAKILAGPNESLANLIEQKKLLEIGRYNLQIGQKKEALRMLKKGMAKKTKETYYRNQIHALLDQINKSV